MWVLHENMRWFAFLPVLLCTACSQWDASLPEPWQRDEPKGSAVIQFDAQGISRVARMDAEVLILSGETIGSARMIHYQGFRP